jgi:hypothetical protein
MKVEIAIFCPMCRTWRVPRRGTLLCSGCTRKLADSWPDLKAVVDIEDEDILGEDEKE